MALRVSDTILNSPRISEAILGGIIARLDRPDQKDRDALHALIKRSGEAGVDDGVAVTMFLHETGNLTAPRWNEDTNRDGAIDLNMAGIGIPANSTVQPFKLANPDEAARLFVNCLVALVTGKRSPHVPVPAGAEEWFTEVWLAKVNHPNFPRVRTVADLNTRYAANNDQHATWAWDDAYPAKLVSRAAEFMPALPDQSATPPKEQPPMSITFAAPPVEIAITPYNNANRPKLYMDPEYETVHEVGNQSPGADEDMHKLFVHNGGGPAQVSFHFVVGPTKVIQLIPLDEAAWHASDGYNGTGNRKSVAIETIQIGDFNKTLWHLAWLLNELEVNPGRFYANQRRTDWKFSINRIKQHHDWAPDQKNCPEFIRNRGLWPTLMQRVDLWHAATTETQPEPEPEPEPLYPKGMTLQSARRLYGTLKVSWADEPFTFDPERSEGRAWLERGKAQLKDGERYDKAKWPRLVDVIRRGNGSRIFHFSDGWAYEQKAS